MGINPSDPGQACKNCNLYRRYADGSLREDVSRDQSEHLHRYRLQKYRQPTTEAIEQARRHVEQWQSTQKVNRLQRASSGEFTYQAHYTPDDGDDF